MTTNFVIDNTSLPNWPKSNFALRPDIPAAQKASATDWNAYLQAIVDIQTFCRGAPWIAMTEQASDPAPAGIARYAWLDSISGHPKVNTSALGIIELGERNTAGAGSFTNANITIDARGRVTAAANGSSSGVTSVGATAPIASSGGTTPTISIGLTTADLVNSGGNLTLATTGVTAQTYAPLTSLTVDTKGRVTGAVTATASVAVANAAGATGTKALSTEGTVDWFFCTANNTAGGGWALQGLSVTHTKLTGGPLAVGSYGRANGASITGSNYGATFTSTAADDSMAAALSSTAMQVFFGAQLNYGWVIRIPIPPGVQRVVRIYVSVFGATITTDAKLTITGTTGTDNFTIGSSQTDKTITVTATGGSFGDELVIHTRVTTNPGSGSYSLAACSVALV